MSFDSYGASQNESGSGNQVDFDELNRYVVETAELTSPEVLTGYVAVIADLGTQEMQDAEVVFTGTEEDERKAVADKPATYFKDGINPETKQPCRLKCWPQKPVQNVAVAIDFPDIIVDKGSFFGEANPLPLRIWYGGQFYLQDIGMVVGRPTPLKVNKKLGNWSLDKKHMFHRMAVASKLIGPDDCFLPQRIDELLGKAFQFEAQVFFKKNKGKEYYTEKVKFMGGLARGVAEPELLTTPRLIQFNVENSPEALKELRKHVINTMKRATNYEGSVIQSQLEEVRPHSVSDKAEGVQEKTEAAPQENPKPSNDNHDDFDDDEAPF